MAEWGAVLRGPGVCFEVEPPAMRRAGVEPRRDPFRACTREKYIRRATSPECAVPAASRIPEISIDISLQNKTVDEGRF